MLSLLVCPSCDQSSDDGAAAAPLMLLRRTCTAAARTGNGNGFGARRLSIRPHPFPLVRLHRYGALWREGRDFFVIRQVVERSPRPFQLDTHVCSVRESCHSQSSHVQLAERARNFKILDASL